MKKKHFLMAALIVLSAVGISAQVTVGSIDNPKATLDVVAIPDYMEAEGIIAPRLTGDRIQEKDAMYGAEQTGAIVYATAAAGMPEGKTANMTAAGYYYFDGSLWQMLNLPAGTVAGQALKWNGRAWEAGTDANDNTDYTGSTSITLNGTSFQRAALTGDVTAAANSNTTTVAAIRGKYVAPNAPASGQVLMYDGSLWRPAPVAAEAWGLNGNSAASGHFLGTVNAYPLIFKVNNVHGGRISHTEEGSASFGYNTLSGATGNYCSAFGNGALQNNTDGNGNCAFGYRALYSNLSGSNNVAIGHLAGSNISTGCHNVTIGSGVVAPDAHSNNTVTIGSEGSAFSTYRIYGAGWTNASDRRMKHDILPVSQGLSFVLKLKPSEFVYNTDKSGKKTFGFIAQDIQEVMACENMSSSYHLVQEMGDGMLGINSSELIPLLVKAIQEQQVIISDLIGCMEELEIKFRK